MSPEKDEGNGNLKPPILENERNKAEMLEEFIVSEEDFVGSPAKKRQKRLVSPAMDFPFDNVYDGALSPSSSSSVDITFEPSIDMMVNDFDDEQTLNEEEALAEQEAHSVQNEIDTLIEESEIPLEDLLAKYGATMSAELPQKQGKIRKSKKKTDKDEKKNPNFVEKKPVEEKLLNGPSSLKVNLHEDTNSTHSNHLSDEEVCDGTNIVSLNSDAISNGEKRRPHRSHLLDLYPESTIATLLPEETANVSLYDENIDDDDEAEDDIETESDYRKCVMVGMEHQASIPEGLSQYGDILPYENEDKLIWEPSQVSEREVEDYLLKIRNIKSATIDSEQMMMEDHFIDCLDNNSEMGREKFVDANGEINNVKDDEQALHLLVQCGYDFKEAIRRKSLNVLPLTGSMSLWSEEECQKFEEGIQKCGKDFLKIRKYVRTRSMREIVQFYYFWKKSERCDQYFTNCDSVDHMDIYLNESGNYGTNNQLTGNLSCTPANTMGSKKSGLNNIKNFSIMSKNGGVISTTSKLKNRCPNIDSSSSSHPNDS